MAPTLTKPRVLFVTTTFDDVTNGPGVYTQNLWNFFADDLEIEFHVVALQSKTRHDHLHLLGRRPRGFGSATYNAICELAKQVLQRLGSKTILHANMAHLITPELAESCRSLVQVNDTEVCCWKPSLANLRRYGLRRNAALCWRKQREQSVVSRAEKTICNSRFTADTIRDAYRLPAERISMIYKAVNLDVYRSAKVECDTAAEQIVFVGSNWRRKGLDTLLEAMKLLEDPYPSVQLKVVGDPGSTARAEYEGMAATLGIDDRVQFVGAVGRDEMPQLLASSTLLALPSYEEALGLAAIEALAAGIPVVASHVGGLPEIVRSDTHGQIVRPGSPSELANAIENVLRAPQSSTLRANRQQSVECFGLPRLETELRQLYLEM
ncbi:MAG: glycosyltransferase family 4 protein [Planctomycetota bacterium]